MQHRANTRHVRHALLYGRVFVRVLACKLVSSNILTQRYATEPYQPYAGSRVSATLLLKPSYITAHFEPPRRHTLRHFSFFPLATYKGDSLDSKTICNPKGRPSHSGETRLPCKRLLTRPIRPTLYLPTTSKTTQKISQRSTPMGLSS